MRNWSTALMFLALAGLIGFLAFGTGSETFFNDTGLEVYGLRVSFDQPVTIVRLGEGFANWTSEESGTTILFTGGAVAIWGTFYFFWEPEEARILTYEWVLSETNTPPPTSTPSENINDYSVTNPGNVLIDPDLRRQYLETLGSRWQSELCVVPWGYASEVIQGKRLSPIIYFERGLNDDTRWKFIWIMNVFSAEYLATNNDEAAIAIIDTLKTWASANALSSLGGSDYTATVYDVKNLVTPTLASYSLVRNHPHLSSEDQELIENWLAMLVRQIDVVLTQNNHSYMRYAIYMEWGALMGDDEYFQKGVAGYISALEQMRPDGSFPRETARGAMAIAYTSHAISSLALMAEIAANQGHNLYDLEQNNLSLHSAITFLLDAIDDPEIIIDYAAENDTCTIPEGCEDYRNQYLLLNMGWTEPYRARFPESDNTMRINKLFEEGVLDYSRSQVGDGEAVMNYPNPLDGAATRCFYSRINSLPTPTPTLSPEQEISLFIYDDAAEPGWDIYINFGQGEIDLSSKSAVHNGQFAIEANMDSWTSFAMWTKPLDTSQFLYLEFYINGGLQGGQMINVLTFSEGVVLTNLATSSFTLVRRLPPEEWLLVRIPVEDLNPDNDPVTGFVIENHSDYPAPTFYVDDIRFVSAGP